jgi:hypothetical protein
MASKFIEYGTQSSAADFAFTDEYYYKKRTWQQHLGTFAMGGLGGIMQSYAMNNPWVDSGKLGLNDFGKRSALSALGYGLEYIGTSFVKGNYQGLYTSGWQTKVGVSSYKSMIYSLIVR